MGDRKYSGSLEQFFDAVHYYTQPFDKGKTVLGMTLRSDDYAQFDSVYHLAKEAKPQLMNIDENLFLKSYELSEKSRAVGNGLFAKKQYELALDYYTEAIRFSPWVGTDASLAKSTPMEILDHSQRARCHANRSAVMFELGKYQLCCDEIDRALANDYPENSAWRLLDRKGRASFEMGHHQGTARCIQMLQWVVKKMDPESADSAKAAKAIAELKKRMEKAGADLNPANYVCRTLTENHLNNRKANEAVMKVAGERKNEEEAEPEKTVEGADGDAKGAQSEHKRMLKESKFPNAEKMVYEVKKEGKGFGFQTSQDIPTGASVVREQCLARFLDSDCWLTHCFNCFMRCNECPLPCKFTAAIVFCGERCAEIQDLFGFGKICGFLPFVSDSDGAGTRLVRLAFALFARHPWVELESLFYGPDSVYLHDAHDNYDPKVRKSDITALLWMSRSPKSENDTDWVWQHAVQALFVTKLLSPKFYCGQKDEKTVCRLGALVLRAIKVLDANGFCCHENVAGRAGSTHLFMKDIGIFVSTTVGRLNHSCVSNAAVHFDRGTVTVRTVVPVKAGEELCISYGPDVFSTGDRAERRRKLKDGWGFDCLCGPCEKGLPSLPDLPPVVIKCMNCESYWPEPQLLNGCTKCGIPGDDQIKLGRAKLNEIGALEREMLAGLGCGGTTVDLANRMAELREKLMPRLCDALVELGEIMHPECALYLEATGMMKNFLDFTNNPHLHRCLED